LNDKEKKFCTKKSRCPCSKANKNCLKCKCFNCNNGKEQELPCLIAARISILPSKKRDHLGKLTQTLAESFMENENVALKGIAWTLKEELLLMEIVGKDKKKVKHDLIWNEYNATIASNSELGSMKTKLQLSKKLSTLK
jgi:hypothetical protein